jgi:glycosyltransferase involved in cell wall biosynthesis
MKICFWGNIGRALNGRTSGGGQLQIALLAKALARGGNEVVVLDYETTEEFQTEDGIIVYPIKGWNGGIRMIRTITHRLPGLYSSLKDQKADVYYCRIRDFRHIFAWLAARKVKAKFILGLAEDLDILNFKMRWKYYYLTYLRSPWVFFAGFFCEIIYPFLLKKSDVVFVQHEGQKQILLNKGIKSILVPNLIDLTQIPLFNKQTHNYFIYVGWLDERKGIIEFFQLVEKSPLSIFKVIGPPRDKAGYYYYNKLKSFNNVSLMGELSHSDTLEQIANAKALISTSRMEGFPNIFVEAWAFGVPVLSLYVDPGSVITKEKLGEFAYGNLDRLINATADIKCTDEFSKRAKDYVEKTHVLNKIKIDEITSIINRLVKHGE